MAKKAKLYDGMMDINLTDTLIGQSFNKEISTSLSPSQSDIQTDPSNPRSGSENDLSPSTSKDQGHDQMSRSQFVKNNTVILRSRLYLKGLLMKMKYPRFLFAIMSKMAF